MVESSISHILGKASARDVAMCFSAEQGV